MNTKTDTLLNLATVLIAMCTATLTGIAVYRQFFSQPASFVREQRNPVFLEDWRDLAAVGHRMGPEDPDVTVVVFSDFECPMCSTFAMVTYPDFRDRHPGRTALVYRHWPLTQHRFAYPAARAAECAAAQGRFTPFHDLLFSGQKQLGLKTFREFAEEAGVPDLRAFDDCYNKDTRLPAIERDIQAAKSIGGSGTPSVTVNGWLIPGGVSPQLLDSIARQFLFPATEGETK